MTYALSQGVTCSKLSIDPRIIDHLRFPALGMIFFYTCKRFYKYTLLMDAITFLLIFTSNYVGYILLGGYYSEFVATWVFFIYLLINARLHYKGFPFFIDLCGREE